MDNQPRRRHRSTPVRDGFALVVGPMLNEGWQRAEEPVPGKPCSKCGAATTRYELKKLVIVYGVDRWKHASVVACEGGCLHEAELNPKRRIA